MCKPIGWSLRIFVVVCTWALGTMPGMSQAQLISSFEHNLSSTIGATWVGPNEATAPLSSYSEFVTTGATDGTSALAIHYPGADDWGIRAILKGGIPLAQAAATHDFLVFDATTTDDGVAGDGYSPSYRNLIPVINSNQGGWQQNQIGQSVAADNGGSLTTLAILDLNTVAPNSNGLTLKANAQAYVDSGGGNGTWFELFLVLQGRDQGIIKAGDYQSSATESQVNAADYVMWRKNVGGTSLTNETVTLGSVDSADYDEWRAQFGNDYLKITTIIDNVRFANAGAGASLGASGVPEPSTALLVLASAFGLVAYRRRSV